MASSLSNFGDYLAEGIPKIKCKKEHYHKKFEACEIKYKDWNFFHEYAKVKVDLIL